MIALIKGLLAIILSGLNIFFSPVFGNFTAETKPTKEDCRLNFAAISDIHMTEETARRDMLRFGLDDMENFSSPLDALVLAGDLTDHGEEAEWEMLKNALSPYSPAKNLIMAQGNHDTWTEDDGYNLAKTLFIKYNNEIVLMGYINEQVFLLHTFKNQQQSFVQTRLTEKQKGADVYLVRSENYKSLIKVTNNNMQTLMKL